MKKKKSDNLYLFSTVTVFTLIALLFAYVLVWDNYKTAIIDEQKEQMQLIASVVTTNFEETLEAQVSELEFLSSLYGREDFLTTLSNYVTEHNKYMDNAKILDERGKLLWSLEEIGAETAFQTYQLGDAVFMTESVNENQEMKLSLSTQTQEGFTLVLYFALGEYYNTLISQIKMGDSGYIVVKNAQGIILMHPTRLQIGQHVIQGREELYGDVELKSLQELVDFQNSVPTGVYEYESYWWLEEDVPSARKIGAHQHIDFGEDFLVVSAVIDYKEVYTPVEEGFRNMAVIFVGILCVALCFFCYVGHLLLENKKNVQEILYLKDLNTLLERNKKIEEHIAHQQRLQIMGTMTGGIAHEFNNMLTPIMGYAELLQLNLEEESTEMDFATEILDASLRATEIVKQISTLGRRKIDATFRFLPVKRMLQQNCKMMQSICPSQIQFQADINLDGCEGFLGNETQINQVLLNIFVNATHAIEEKGKITLKAEILPREQLEKIHQSSVSPLWEQFFAISIQDDGMGMEEETLRQIFHPFFTTKKKDQGLGLGLGLALVSQIVEGHQGHIYVKTKAKQGSKFTLCFPVAEEPQILSLQSGASGLGILFVANEDKLYQSMKKKLTKLGVRCLYTSSAQEAKHLLATGISVVVIDKELTTPKGNQRGLHFSMAIHSQFPDIQKILLVDAIDREILDAKDQGFITAYGKKPIQIEALMDLIRQNA